MTFPQEPGANQSWENRVRRGAYTSPNGTRILFDFEDVSREGTKRGTVYEFANVDGAYVQQTGNGPLRYPLRCIFWGRDCDRQATAFEAAIFEEGLGKLEHPLYGTFTVVPFGDWNRRDDLKTAANQTIVEVTFWRTLLSVYPDGDDDPQSEILAALEGFDVAASQQFANKLSFADARDRANLKASIEKMLGQVDSALQGVSGAVQSVNQTFRDAQSVVNYGLDVLVGEPLQLALQISNLIKAPARALSGIESRLDAYSALATSIFGSSAAKPSETLATGTGLEIRRSKISNDFHASDLFAANAVAGSVLATVATPIADPAVIAAGGAAAPRKGRDTGAQFTTKPQVLTAAEGLLAQLDAFVLWRDSGFAALGEIPTVGEFQVDTGESYQALQAAVAGAYGFLVRTSFSLVPERRLTLDRARTIVDLSAELYRSVDNETLDFLINSNNLTGDQILELPRGTAIFYYP